MFLTMMSKIDVLIYSYKGKMLKDVVKSLYSNATGEHELSVTIIDQHPIIRDKMFSELSGVKYRHVFWDWQKSPALYKKEFIQKSAADYIMILADNTVLGDSWDRRLAEFELAKEVVISGNKVVTLKQDSPFYINKEFRDTQSFELTNFCNRSLVFFSRDLIKNISYPDYIKYNGEEEALSVEIFTSNIDIYSAPTEIYTSVGRPTLEELYAPFSLHHNYNEVVELFKTGKNNFYSTLTKERSVVEFLDFHGVDSSTIHKLPFQTNDVNYDPNKMNFNAVDARRFVARTKAIH